MKLLAIIGSYYKLNVHFWEGSGERSFVGREGMLNNLLHYFIIANLIGFLLYIFEIVACKIF